MAYNYWIKTVFEEVDSGGKDKSGSPEKEIIQLSKIGECFKRNGKSAVHDGKHLNLYVKIVEVYDGVQKIHEIIYFDVFENGKQYVVKKETARKLHSPLMK